MKKSKLILVFGFIVLLAIAAALLPSLFNQPEPKLTMHDLFRAEDASLQVQGFQCTIVNNELADCNYSVKTGDGTFVQVYYPAVGEDPVVKDSSSESDVLSALTLEQARALIQPIWNACADKSPKEHTISLMLISPQTVNNSLSTQRKTDLTLSVSTGVLTEVTETYLGNTDYGMLFAEITNQSTQSFQQLYVMLIP